MSFPPLADCGFLTGPTACGKTAVGVALAERIGAEILCLDSMAVYRGLDIGTAKPTPEQRRRVPHHLVDLVDIDEEFSIADFVAAAHRAADEIRRRRRRVLVVGGTALYLKALLRGLFVGPAADWELRRRMQAEAEQSGGEALHARLAVVDPITAARLHPNDVRRIIRALEVFEKTTRPISDWQQQFSNPRPQDLGGCVVLERRRETLYGRIDERVDAMFAAGLVDETQSLLAAGRAFGRTASQALGYREVLDHLTGRATLADTMQLVKTRTRQFAKRQLTWFRSLAECRTVTVDDPASVDEVAEHVLNVLANSPADT